ncbi:hypothetical protein BS17DRAFT_715289, partial [Gyrodon lividus]
VHDATTCCRHLAYKHKVTYLQWCKTNQFKSMLPLDAQGHRLAAVAVNSLQAILDDHLQDVTPTEHVVTYSQNLFPEAAVEWLISTNQPIQTVKHLSFKKMINIASCATNGVIVPN